MFKFQKLINFTPIIFAFLILVASFSKTGSAEENSTANLTKTLSNAYQKRADNGLFVGAAVGVVDPTQFKDPLLLTFGEARTIHDRFEIGSISKSFTGILLSKLSLEGKIDLEKPIEQYVPELKGTFAGTVTAHLLATHSAQFVNDEKGELKFLDSDLIQYLKKYSPGEDRPKGERHYSNLSFMTLSLVIRKVTGQNFTDLVENQIFKPFAMLDTGFINQKEVFSYILQPHNILQEKVNYDLLLDLAAATGGVYSSLFDMTKYTQANLNPENFPDLKEAILLSQKLGLGWDSKPGETTIHKNGAMTGFGSYIEFNPLTKSGAVTLCNSLSTTSATILTRIALGSKDEFLGYLSVNKSLIQKHLGTYTTDNYAVDLVETPEGFLGIHERLINSKEYLGSRLLPYSDERIDENKFFVFDGLSQNDKIEFTTDPITQKISLHYFEYKSKELNGSPIYNEMIFEKL